MTNLENQLAETLDQEASRAMALTDPSRELRRFRKARYDARRRTQRMAATAVAAAVVVAGGTIVGTHVTGGAGSHHATRVSVRPPSQPLNPRLIRVARTGKHVRRYSESQRPAGHVTTLAGPLNVGFVGLGALWATAGNGSSATLLRVSLNGSSILSTTRFLGLPDDSDAINPVRVGNSVLVATQSSGFTGFTVFDDAGSEVGTLPSTAPFGVAGDSTGGWMATTNNVVTQLDASGHGTGRTITLPSTTAIDGLALGGGDLWVIDSATSSLLRVNLAAGKVAGIVRLPATPLQVAFADGSVYVSDGNYTLSRIDPTNLTVTAAIQDEALSAFPYVGPLTGGGLWVEQVDGSAAQLDPKTLRVLRNIKLFRGDPDDSSYGVAATAGRIYLANGNHVRSPLLYTAPLH